MLLPGGYHEIFRLVVLKDEPHTFHIIRSISPVAQRREIAEIKLLLFPLRYTRGRKSDLAGHEGLAATLALMVEQYSRATEHPVGLAIFLDNPESIELCHGIRAVGVERSLLVLRHGFHLAIQFRCRCLVDAACVPQACKPYRLQHAQCPGGIDIGRIFRHVKRHLHMALGRKIIYLVGTDGTYDLQQAHGVGHVGIMKMKMGMPLKMGDSFTIVRRAAANDAVYVISFIQEELRQVRAILTRNAGYKCLFHI